jgi:hypothetical protein
LLLDFASSLSYNVAQQEVTPTWLPMQLSAQELMSI